MELLSTTSHLVIGRAFRASGASTSVIVGRTGNAQDISSATVMAIVSSSLALRTNGVTTSVIFTPIPVVPLVPVDTVFTEDGDASQITRSFVVPDGVTQMEAYLWGASGGAGRGYSPKGTLVSGGGVGMKVIFNVVAGDTLTFQIGRGGYGATELQEGAGGWPDGTQGLISLAHEAFGGGSGGSTTLFADGGALVARAGGSQGTGGMPIGGSAIGATDYELGNVVSSEVEVGQLHFPGLQSDLAFSDFIWGQGVLNPDGTEDAVDGVNGAVLLRYYV